MSDYNAALEVASVIGEGGIVVSPTDTVYGLLADASNEAAVKRLFELKKRPRSKPLLILVDSVEMLEDASALSRNITAVAHHFWSNGKPLTFVVPFLGQANHGIKIAESVTAGNATVAVRLPAHEFLLEVIRQLGKPLVAPSANVHGRPPATNYQSVVAEFGHEPGISMIVDGGESKCTLASTIVDLSQIPYRIIREGSVPGSEVIEFAKPL
jgi:L-threonylcarbamoyladenylate synthase